MCPEDMQSIKTLCWLPPEAESPDADHSYPVFLHGNGDAIGYTGPDRSFLYNHEIPALEPDDLVAFAREFFTGE
jgi:hypothetical protein